LPKLMEQVRQVYECLAGELPLIFRGGSWRLPDPVASQQVVAPFLNLADEFGLTGMMCKENLLSTR